MQTKKIIQYPMMVHKNGKRGDHKVVLDTKDLIVKAAEGFYPMGLSSKEEVRELDYVVKDLIIVEAERLGEAEKQRIITEAMSSAKETVIKKKIVKKKK